MLRINLLPPYIYDKKKKKNLAIAWGAAAAAVVLGFFVWNSSVQAQLTDEKTKEAEAQRLRQDYDAQEASIKKVNEEIAEIQRKQTFVADANKFNAGWRDFFLMMRDVTSPNIILKSITAGQDRQTVNITGFAKSESEMVKWVMELLNDQTHFTNIGFSLLPKPYVPGAETASATGTAPMGGARGAMAMAGASPMSGSGGGGGGGMGAIMQAMSGRGGGGAAAGGAGGIAPGLMEGRQGIDFTIVARLAKPIAADVVATPTWPAGAGTGAAGGNGMAAAMGAMGGGGTPGMGGSMGAMGGTPTNSKSGKGMATE